MNKKLMQGTFWLTFANLLCKVLGVVYLIPWLSMMGNNQDGMLATTLYNVGYLPYGLFLMLGTVGFPNAIAKKVAVATKEGDNAACRLIFRSTINIMFVIGIASAALMYLFAPLLAGISPIANVNNGILAIRSLCPSLIAIPILSAMRGYFQGKNDLRPYGTSLIIEQAVRVIVILAGTYYLRVLTDGTILEAVLISTVASLFGGVSAIIHKYIVGRRKDCLYHSGNTTVYFCRLSHYYRSNDRPSNDETTASLFPSRDRRSATGILIQPCFCQSK